MIAAIFTGILYRMVARRYIPDFEGVVDAAARKLRIGRRSANGGDGARSERAPMPRWFTPALFILGPVAMSFGAWAALAAWRNREFRSGPFEKLAGWPDPSPVEPKGIVLLLIWYAVMVAVATVGWRFGSAGGPPSPKLMTMTATPQFEKRYFLLIAAIAIVGVGYTYVQIASATSILGALGSSTSKCVQPVDLSICRHRDTALRDDPPLLHWGSTCGERESSVGR